MTVQEKQKVPLGDRKKQPDQADLDEALEETFPASDPVSVTQGIIGIPDRADKDEQPKKPQS